MPFKTSDFLRAAGGIPRGPLPESFSGAAIDSRKVKPGNLYVALKGEKADGRDFAAHAVVNGAALVLAEGEPPQAPGAAPLPWVSVENARRAFSCAARAWRISLKARVAGVTGSSGKTTTKEFLAALLRTCGKTAATEGNHNNDLGLPLSILNAPGDALFGVFECGTNHHGEIAALADVLRPDCAIVSSIGEAHIENFGSLDGTAREKGALFAAVPECGFNAISRENARFDILKSMSKARLVETSCANPTAPFYARTENAVTGSFTVFENGKAAARFETGIPGEYNISNALLAYAAARNLGAEPEACANALRGFSLPGRRWHRTEKDGVLWIDDAYNANPSSMKAALGNFALWPCKGRRIAVLGDMFELGKESLPLHRAVARFAAGLGLDIVVATGDAMSAAFAPEYHAAAPRSIVVSVPDTDSAHALLESILRPGDTVLLKGSRGMEMENVMEVRE